VEQGETERSQHVGGPQVALDPLHDRGQRDQLTWGVQFEELVDERRCRLDRREPVTGPGTRRLEIGISGRTGQVVRFERRLALLRAAPLVTADRAAVVPEDRPRHPVLLRGPGEFVRDEHPAARRATGREQVADRHLQAGLAPW
jgi:hypothetical protein